MLKKIINEAFFTVRITTTGPLLIKSGRDTVSGPGMSPVLTFRNEQQQVFIPGSSLKGVFRSHVERVAGSLKTRVICYPFSVEADKEVDRDQRKRDYRESCGEMFNKIARNDEGGKKKERSKRLDERKDIVYAASCPICRLFGSTSFIGRVAINDAYLADDTKEAKELRDGVGIDRLTGGASHSAKFELEVVSTGVAFETDIHLRNFELWQLGMLFVVLQDMKDELIPLGSGRSRGLGKVKAEIVQQDRPNRLGGVVIRTIRGTNLSEPDDQLWGLGKWLDDADNKALENDRLLGLSFPGDGGYGTWRDDFITLESPLKHEPNDIRLRRVFKDTTLTNLYTETMKHFVRRMQNWPTLPEPQMAHQGQR